MNQETDSLIQHKTSDFGYCPLKKKLVYMIKQRVNNQITYFKSRWVIRRYLPQAEIDFDQTFMVEVKPITFWGLFAIAVFYDLVIKQMDVKSAFLYGISDQLLYVEVFCDYEQQQKYQICLLKKTLYGLKQAP